MAETTATTTATAAATKKTVMLRSSDGEEFEVAEAVALQCQTIKHMIEDECAENGIPLPNVDGKTLAKVIEYCNKHATTTTTANGGDKAAEVSSFTSFSSVSSGDVEMKAWDAEFLKVDQNTLFDLILAANYLDIKSLLDLTCKTVADMMRGKKPEEIREMFNIKNDYTSEEEDEVRKENAWAFD